MARHAWRVDKAPAKTHKNRNACLDALRSNVAKKIGCLYGIRCELVNNYFVKDIHVHMYLSFQRICFPFYQHSHENNYGKTQTCDTFLTSRGKESRAVKCLSLWTDKNTHMNCAI